MHHDTHQIQTPPEFEMWYRERYGRFPMADTHTTGRLDAWRAARELSEQKINELMQWKMAVIDACTVSLVDASGNEPDPRALINKLIEWNIEMAEGLRKANEAPPSRLHSYETADDRTLKQITTEKPMSKEQHRAVNDRRVNARRQTEDRRMEDQIYRKFGE